MDCSFDSAEKRFDAAKAIETAMAEINPRWEWEREFLEARSNRFTRRTLARLKGNGSRLTVTCRLMRVRERLVCRVRAPGRNPKHDEEADHIRKEDVACLP